MRRFLVVWLAALTASQFLGCTAPPPHPYEIATGAEGTTGIRRIVLLPLNVMVALPDELQEPSRRVFALTNDALRDAGRSVESVGLFEARDLWRRAVKQVQTAADSEQDFGAAAPLFIEKLVAKYPCDAVVIPSLIYRKARIYGGTRDAAWDGVKREVRILNEAHEHMSVILSTEMYGAMEAVSLQLLVFDSNGRKLFSSHAGLDVVHDFEMSGAGSKTRVYTVLRKDRLSDEAAIRDGIRLAFEPFLMVPVAAPPDS